MAQPDTVRRSRRERIKAQTSADLVGAARTLIAERGVAGLRVSDITDKAGVGLGSFYSHFESKDDIVEAVVSSTVGGLVDAIVLSADQLEDPAEATSIGIRLVVNLCFQAPEIAQVLINLDHAQDHFEEMVWAQALGVIAGGVASGRFTTDDPEMALTIAVGAVTSVMRGVLAGRHGHGADSACAEALLRSLGLTREHASEIAHRPLPA